eukprot:scaffold7125_cov118-Isochrysis_galbana.AAC.5
MAVLMALTTCAGGGAAADGRIRESAVHARSSSEPLVRYSHLCRRGRHAESLTCPADAEAAGGGSGRAEVAYMAVEMALKT